MSSSRAHILFVEDSSLFREMQSLLLEKAGFAVSAHDTASSALAAARNQTFDLVVIDYELPDMNGEQLMLQLRAIQPEVGVIFVSGALTIELAIKLSSQGVAGIFNKPPNPKNLLEKINETVYRHAARDTAVRGHSSSPHGSAPAPYVPPEPPADQCAYTPQFVFGASEAFRDFTHRIWKVRDFRAVLLLQGEPGSPFEQFARELAEISQFRIGPVMTCAAPQFEAQTLIEALAPCLLSHDAGTLIVTGVETFTDEQQKTLENLVTGRDVFLPFARRFRLVLAATNDLSTRVDEGTFDETLFYKISSLTLPVPTLREMAADIPVNAAKILGQLQATMGPDTPATLSAEAAALLQKAPWPGNYAQLVETLHVAAERSRGLGSVGVDALCEIVPAVAPSAESETVPPFVAPGANGASPKSYFRPASPAYLYTNRLANALNRAGVPAAAV